MFEGADKSTELSKSENEITNVATFIMQCDQIG